MSLDHLIDFMELNRGKRASAERNNFSYHMLRLKKEMIQ